MNSQLNTSIFERDSSRFSVQLLVQALERNDPTNLTVLAKSVLRATYDHFFFASSGKSAGNWRAWSATSLDPPMAVDSNHRLFLGIVSPDACQIAARTRVVRSSRNRHRFAFGSTILQRLTLSIGVSARSCGKGGELQSTTCSPTYPKTV
jgi:hypothetical protein